MAEPIDFDALDDRPLPPSELFKYVVPDRIDVLKNSQIRFTPPVNTNDIFEVRQTFDLLLGPKAESYLREEAKTVNVDEVIKDALSQNPIFENLSVDDFKSLFKRMTGQTAENALFESFEPLLGDFLGFLNDPDRVENLLVDLGSKLICLSLAERPDISPMWAHYAANGTGFVICFDTTNHFFRTGDKKEREGLFKISYFDGTIPEMIDDPYKALFSKQADWTYEREWRIFRKIEEATEIVEIPNDIVHLVEFPKPAVNRVIVGPRATDELIEALHEILRTDYPHATISRMSPNRKAAKLSETPI